MTFANTLVEINPQRAKSSTEQAAQLVRAIDGIRALLALFEIEEEAASGWSVSFPAKNGHPKLGAAGEGYSLMPGKIYLGTGEKPTERHITISAANGELLGRPHSIQSVKTDPLREEPAIYEALRVVVDPEAEQPFVLQGINSDGEAEVPSGVYQNDARWLGQRCLGAILRTEPSPVA